MKTEKEKELDELFRSGLENPGPDANFIDDDWDAMEAMLDGQQRRRRVVLWWPILSGVAALLLLSLGWFFIYNKPQVNVVANQVKKTVIKGDSLKNEDNKRMLASKPESTPDHNEPVKEISGSADDSKKTTGSQSKTNNLAINNHQYSTVKGAHSNKSLQHLNAFSNYFAKNNSTTKGQSGNINTGDADGNLLNASENSGRNALIANSRFVLRGDSAKLLMTALPLPHLDKPINTPDKNYKKAIKKVNNNFRRTLAVTVLASPDLNGTSGFSGGKVGTNLGMMFALGVSKRFTISTGAMYSVKPYMTDFSNYHPTYQFKNDPQNVSANCKVLDIPINVDYQLYHKAQDKFSIGSGLSTYFMLKEDYHYNYEYANTPGPTDYSITNRNKYFLGVLNLNATYQRQINSKFGLAVQPYYKLPLTNIGYGQVKLQSAGVAIGVSWNLNAIGRR